MAIPAVPPYPMPERAELPANRVGWRPDPERAVLLVHDMQNYFLRAFDRTAEPVPTLLANIARLAADARERGIPVLYSAQPGGQTTEQRGLLEDFWGGGIGTDPREQEIVPELSPAPGDILLTKWRYSAFVRTDLRDRLRAAGRDQLVICGIYAHIGVLMTACDAFMHECEAFVVGDAVADFSAADHTMALEYAAARCAAVLSVADVCAPVAVP